MFIGSILINIVLSLLIIYIGHYVWNYIKETYSTKKTKDLVNTQIKKYKKMMQEMQDNHTFLNEEDKLGMDLRLMEFMENIN